MKINLSKSFSVPAVQYASQGNAILGIRDSGKSYSATLIAEQLLEAKIPFIAFDPIGVWKYLKIGKNKHPGYQIVVAGSEGDLPLKPETASNIVRAAMQENIPLVLDLYSMELSKADWKRIVEQSIRLLLYENKTCGLRHVFIEEAAEFVPQRVGNDQGKVYAEIEKLARMGGNASLGYTLINQRAEEVNKAVLELCDCLILHRQKGRHSLTALGKWLDIADVNTSKEIIKSLPSLEQGECWVWLQGSHEPQRIKISEKNTVHPDRRNPLKITSRMGADVTSFVDQMKSSLAKQDKKPKPVSSMRSVEIGQQPMPGTSEDQVAIQRLESANTSLKNELAAERSKVRILSEKLKAVQDMLKPDFDKMQAIFSEVSNGHTANTSAYQNWLDKLGSEKKLLELLIDRKRLSKSQAQILLGLSKESVRVYTNTLKRAQLVRIEDGDLVLQEP
jgi:hypothetical protein